MKTIEFMSMPFQVRAAEIKEVHGKNIGQLEGYAGVKNNIDFGRDRIKDGAFTKTIQETKGVWPVLADHNERTQIGFNKDAKEDHFGLLIVEEINLDVTLGLERFSLAKQALDLKAESGLSIGYTTIKSAHVTEDGIEIRELLELKMWEHSHVTFGMNDLAFITAAKNWDKFDVKQAIRALIEHASSAGVSPKEVLQEIDIAVKGSVEPSDIVHSMKKLTEFMK